MLVSSLVFPASSYELVDLICLNSGVLDMKLFEKN